MEQSLTDPTLVADMSWSEVGMWLSDHITRDGKTRRKKPVAVHAPRSGIGFPVSYCFLSLSSTGSSPSFLTPQRQEDPVFFVWIVLGWVGTVPDTEGETWV